MGLDIAMMDATGDPLESVTLSVDEHWTLLQQAQRLELNLWLRMSDYYEDATYTPEELPALADEIGRLESGCHNPGARARLHELTALLRLAMDQRRTVCALAD